MLFNSLDFLIFFPIVTVLYFLLPQKLRWVMLLVASCIFYMFFVPAYILILIFTIIIDYIAGICIERLTGKNKKIFLIISIFSNIGILFFFKYFNFFNDNIACIARLLHWNYPIENLWIVLPIGLSFHTFQSLSYVIEVYRGHQKAERHFGIYALYVMFYPQLVAGPIERPQNMLHQFYEYHRFDYKRVTGGLKLMAWGFFKKVVIADRLALLVNQVYNNSGDYTGLPLVIATVFFSFQIFCDFSGYSDIAIGAAQVMGFKLMANFRRPYLSKSLSDFWRRWHISLSTWFKDYLYISLGGNRVSRPRWMLNLLITFLVSGLWHGANWTYVIWGGLNGLFQIISFITGKVRNKVTDAVRIKRLPALHTLIQIFITFVLISFTWIFFRANSMSDALHIISSIPRGLFDAGLIRKQFAGLGSIGFDTFYFLISITLIIFMESIHLLEETGKNIWDILSTKPAIIRYPVYYLFILTILMLGEFGSNEFLSSMIYLIPDGPYILK
ncbi:MAG: putative rane protein involved in D-alanine export [Eubacterium sp.]|nr:putative rane protein involved in D-alanine export [Eubacterium sp.]